MPSRPRIAPRARPPNAPVPHRSAWAPRHPIWAVPREALLLPRNVWRRVNVGGWCHAREHAGAQLWGGGFFGVNFLTGVQGMHRGTVQSDSTQGYTGAHPGYTGVHRGTQHIL
jgi:hypothetical protein